MVRMLEGKKILIVEDEVMLALDLRFAMEDMGADVIGPCHGLSRALEVAEGAPIDGAILDVDLGGEAVFPLADRLRRRHVPFVFHTGRHNPAELSGLYDGVAVCPKPISPERVAQELLAVMARGQRRGSEVAPGRP